MVGVEVCMRYLEKTLMLGFFLCASILLGVWSGDDVGMIFIIMVVVGVHFR